MAKKLSATQSALLSHLQSKPKDWNGDFLFWEPVYDVATARTAESLERIGLVEIARRGNFRDDWKMRAICPKEAKHG